MAGEPFAYPTGEAVSFERAQLLESSDDEEDGRETRNGKACHGEDGQGGVADTAAAAAAGVTAKRPRGWPEALDQSARATPGSVAALQTSPAVGELLAGESAPVEVDRDELLFREFLASLSHDETVAAPSALLLDDDDEFDYAKASLFIDEPQEEFREDAAARISSEEMFHLITEQRRCTRHRHSLEGKRQRRDAEEEMARGGTAAAADGREAPTAIRGDGGEKHRLFQLLKFKLLSPAQEQLLERQLHAHTQLLLNTLLIASQRRANARLSPEDVAKRQRAREMAWTTLDDLLQKRDASRAYRRVLGGMDRTFFHAPPLDHLQTIERLAIQPALHGADGLVSGEQASLAYAALANLPGVLLREYMPPGGIAVEDESAMSRGLDAGASSALDWIAAEDALLERCLSRHGVLWHEHCQQFLPHRSLEECQARYRHWTRRDAPDNRIKHIIMRFQQPLSKSELQALRQGVNTFGECWDAIQAFLLPHRDKVLLERVWRYEAKRARKRLQRRRRRWEQSAPVDANAHGVGVNASSRSPPCSSSSSHRTAVESAPGGDIKPSTVTAPPAHGETVSDTTQASPADDPVWIEREFSRQEDRQLLLTVRDLGDGVDEQHLFQTVAAKLGHRHAPTAYRQRYLHLLSLL